MKNFKIIHKLYLGFGILIISMLLVLGYTYMNFIKVSEVVDVNLSTYQVMRESDGILTSIVDLEAGSRGYVIMGDEKNLQLYNDGKAQFTLHYNALKRLISQNGLQQRRLEDFLKEYEIWLGFQTDIIAKKRLEISVVPDIQIVKPPNYFDDTKLPFNMIEPPKSSKSPTDLMKSGNDREQMNNLRGILEAINAEEKRSLGIESEHLKVTKAETYLSIVIGGLITTILAVLISFFTSVSITKPIKMLIRATENITKRNYQGPIDLKTDKELEALIKNFNAMQEAIQSREEDLQKKNEAIKIKMIEANEANRLKNQFVANMSHELRTPLNSIIGFTTRVIKRSGDILPAIQLENLKIVKEEGYHLLDLIMNLMDYAKIQSGKMNLEIETFNLGEVIGEVNDMIKPLVDKKKLIYNCEVDTDKDILMTSDRIKIKQILVNLLSNAVKYSDKGCIKLSISFCDKDCCLKIEDQGIGIASEDFSSIFEEFRQVDGSYTRKVGGTGLGLSITKNFIDILGGRIEVESLLGAGSCFTIYIPMELNIENSEIQQIPYKDSQLEDAMLPNKDGQEINYYE